MARIQPINHTLILLLTTQLVVGCMMGKDYQRPDIKNIPENFSYKNNKNEIDNFIAKDWWNNFNDPVLNEIVATSIKNNWNMQIATERIIQSRAVVEKEGSSLLPQVGLGAYTARKQTGETNVPTAKGLYDELGAGAGAFWEVDLFGRIRRKKESAEALNKASIADRENVLLIVITQVIQEYSQLRMVQEQIKLLNENITLSLEKVRYNETLQKQGLISSLTMHEVLKQNDLLKAKLPKLLATEDSLIYSLSILSGGFPKELEELLRKPSGLLTVEDTKMPKTVPSTILRSRPDIRSIEQKMVSSNALVGSAIADFMPKFSIPLGTGYNTTPMDMLFNPASFIWNVGANLIQPVYTGGRLTANLDIAKSVNKEDQLAYEQSVRMAIKEVEDSLSNYYQYTNEEVELNKSVSNQSKVVKDANKLLQIGLQSKLKNLQYEQELLELKSNKIIATNSRVYYLTMVYKSIGGDWTGNETDNQNN